MSTSRGSASVIPITGSSFSIVGAQALATSQDPSYSRTVMRKRFRSNKFQVLYYLSITILISFVVEIALKLYVFHKEFFSHKLEILDVIVVLFCLILDITILFQIHNLKALRLVILLRLWRVARITKGMSTSVKIRGDREISKLKLINHQLALKIQLLETECIEKDQEIERLKQLRECGTLE